MELKFMKAGINGEGIAYISRQPVFCEGVYPGETAEVKITQKNEHYSIAELVRIKERSPHRIRPLCPHMRECGGCPFMALDTEAQHEYKTELLAEALWKYARIRRTNIRKMHGADTFSGYRTACKLPTGEKDGRLVTGMYARNSNRFIPIDDCPAHTPALENTRKAVLAVLNRHGMTVYDPRTRTGLRYLVLRTIGEESQLTLVTGKQKLSKEMIDDLSAIPTMKGIFQSINTKRKTRDAFGSDPLLLYGEPHIRIAISGIQLQLSPRSFFQLNAEEAEKLYAMAVSKIDPCERLVEAYCGVGAMSLLASDKAAGIIGIENVPEAVDNAVQNASINGITNTAFICADAAGELLKQTRKQPIDTILADPPRAGLSDEMLEAILQAKPKRIVYVSCNPATLAKNLNVLKHAYHIVTIIPWDMFPGTAQVESVTVMVRMNEKNNS
ncbi:MAG: 23S rRNA (uracil(1939)-C(5))-methyltransferase RlmD [Solobacterium sp.]|nr:23S rRNA (uracil(1939)-C(5))-methyltransferase RlmD [Solobacterium sp.]